MAENGPGLAIGRPIFAWLDALELGEAKEWPRYRRAATRPPSRAGYAELVNSTLPASRMHASKQLRATPEGCQSFGIYGINRLALAAAVSMILAPTRIMASQQTGADQIGHGATDIGLAGAMDAIANFGIEPGVSRLGVGLRCQTDSIGRARDETTAALLARRHRRQGLAQPIADWHGTALARDQGAYGA